MPSYNCPSCGAAAPFQAKSSVFAVCAYCRTMLVRHDVNLEALGKTADLLDDMSPIQIGTQGKYEGESFRVVGKIRWLWSDGAWNEWYLDFGGGKDGWLAEAQGLFAVSRRHELDVSYPPLNELSIGDRFKITEKAFTVDDIKLVSVVAVEGELPQVSPIGFAKTSVDLSEPNGAFASLEFDTSGTSLYVGQYLELEEMKASNLRSLDGWR